MASSLLLMVLMSTTALALPPTHARGYCSHPTPPKTPPVVGPPTLPPPVRYPPPSPTSPSPTCSIDALNLGLCLNVLGGVVHVGVGDPIVHVCCPVIQGLLEVEAAVCLCTAIRLKVLNLNVFAPLALQVLAICGKNPPPGFVCPPLHMSRLAFSIYSVALFMMFGN